jgi:hypothetical protein
VPSRKIQKGRVTGNVIVCMKKEARMILAGVLAVVMLAVLSGFVMETQADTSASPQWIKEQVVREEIACTMEAKVCPDGTYVGRVAPYCQFAPCPNVTTLPINEID